MKYKKDKEETIIFSNDESTVSLFEKIKDWEPTSQVDFAVSFDNPKRTELFEKIIDTLTDIEVKQNVSLIKQRIEQAAFSVSDFSPDEVIYYQKLFAGDFYHVLHLDDYVTFIEDKIRELHFICNGILLDLKTLQYEFLEEREQDKIQLTDAERYKVYLEKLLSHLRNPPPQQSETKPELGTIELKPILKSEVVETVFGIIKDFFSPEHQGELKNIIISGNKASDKLLFKGSGNRLTDTFKKLIEHDFITGCYKRDLINWIISNFTFTHRNKVKGYTYDTVEKTISRNDNPCKSPLIEIKNGQIHRVDQPRKRKQSKY